MKSFIILAIVLPFLVNCSTTPDKDYFALEEYEYFCKLLVNEHIDSAVTTMGIANKDYQLRDGTKVYEFIATNNKEICKTTFFTDKSGIIKKYSWTGDSCRAPKIKGF